MLIDQYPYDDVFARVRHLAQHSDPVLRQLDRLLEDEQLYRQGSKPLVQEQLEGGRDAFRSRMRTMRRGLQTLHRLRRQVGEDKAEQRKTVYARLLAAKEAA